MRTSYRSINTILGPDSSIGLPSSSSPASYPAIPSFKVAGSLHINGDVRADITADGNVMISASSRVQGSVAAAAVIVAGIVEGSITGTESVTLSSSSVVLGDVATRALKVDEGAVLCGRVRRTDREDT